MLFPLRFNLGLYQNVAPLQKSNHVRERSESLWDPPRSSQQYNIKAVRHSQLPPLPRTRTATLHVANGQTHSLDFQWNSPVYYSLPSAFDGIGFHGMVISRL